MGGVYFRMLDREGGVKLWSVGVKGGVSIDRLRWMRCG
jgi:hypothetical protein